MAESVISPDERDTLLLELKYHEQARDAHSTAAALCRKKLGGMENRQTRREAARGIERTT